jgi:hypothetical protein
MQDRTTMDLTKSQWTEVVERIVEKFFPDLIEDQINFFMEDLWFIKWNCLFFSGAIEHATRNLYLQREVLKNFTIRKCLSIILHELRHFWQMKHGLLSDEISLKWFEEQKIRIGSSGNNPENILFYDQKPWEKDATQFEENNIKECYKLYLDMETWKVK